MYGKCFTKCLKKVQIEQQENRRLAVAELNERIRDRYWSVEEMGDIDRTQSFISMLQDSVNPIISQFDKKILGFSMLINNNF